MRNFDNFRQKFLYIELIVLVITVLPALISLLSLNHFKLDYIFYLTISSYLILLSITIYRKKLPFTIGASAFILFLYLMAIFNYLVIKSLEFTSHFLIISIIPTWVFFSIRKAIYVSIFSILTILVMIYLHQSGIIILGFTYRTFFSPIQVVLHRTADLFIFFSYLGVLVFLFKKHFTENIEMLIKNRDELNRTNEMLLEEVDKRIHSEETLKTEHINFKTIFDKSVDSIMIMDLNFNIIDANQITFKLTGFSREEMINHRILDFLIIKDPQHFAQKVKDLMENKHGNELYEFIFVTKTGEHLYIETNSSIILHEDKKVILSIIRNYTERKKTEDALIESKEQFKTIFDSVNDAIFVHNKDNGAIINVNHRSCEMFGYNREEFQHLQIGDLSSNVSPYTQLDALNWINKAELNCSQLFEWHAKHRDGTLFWAEMNLRKCIMNQTECILVTVRDISKRKEYENALIIEELRYKALYENANDSIFILKDMKIISCNSKTLELFGYTQDEMISKSPADLSPEYQPDGRSSFKKANDKLNKVINGYPQRFEWRHLTKDGLIVNTEVSLNRLIINGEYLIQAIVRDITEKLVLQQKIFQNTIEIEEKERNRIASELHDGLGPLLSTAKVYLYTMAEDIEALKTNQLSTKLISILDQSIMTVKEISNNVTPQVLTDYGLASALRSFVNNINHLKKIKINFNTNLHARFNSTIETSLFRIITELINNSLKHAEATEITISLNKENDKITIQYIDNGKGFDIQHVLNNPQGMGLQNIKNRIKFFDGLVTFESESQKGLNVNIELTITN